MHTKTSSVEEYKNYKIFVSFPGRNLAKILRLTMSDFHSSLWLLPMQPFFTHN